MKTDALFYRLFSRLPKALFDLLGVVYRVPYRMISEEIKQTAFRLDGILIPQSSDLSLPLYFVEVQFQPDEKFYSRLFSEVFLYLHQKQPERPYQVVVVYPSQKIERMGRLDHYGEFLMTGKVSRIYLDQMAHRWDDSFELQLVSLIGADARDPKRIIHRSREILARHGSQDTLPDLVDWVETILTYQFPKMSREEIQKMLNTFDMDLKQTRFYQDVFGEGEQAGLLKGEQAGLLKGERQLITRQLKHRFGPLSVAVVDRIGQLTLSQLETLGDVLLDFKEISDLETWFSNMVS